MNKGIKFESSSNAKNESDSAHMTLSQCVINPLSNNWLKWGPKNFFFHLKFDKTKHDAKCDKNLILFKLLNIVNLFRR